MAACLDTHLAQDSLSCGICFEKYNTSHHVPKVLPCQHTFCGACVYELIAEAWGHLECPVCRRKVRPAEVTTNLGLRDVVEELYSKQNKKMCCSDHGGKECNLVCIDCCQPLCTKCMKGMRYSVHKDHDIDDIEEAMVYMKKSLSTVIEEKIAETEKTSAAKLDSLMEKSTQHTQDVEAVVNMVTAALSSWREIQLQDKERKVQEAITEQTNFSRSLKSSWENKLKMSNFQNIISVRQAIENNICRVEDFDVSISLCHGNIDQLRDTLSSVCNHIQTDIRDGVFQHTVQNTTGTAVNQFNQGVAEMMLMENACRADALIRVGPLMKQDRHVLKQSTASQTEEQNIHSNTEMKVAPQTTQSTSICPKCNANIPLCLKRRANLYNLQRNKKFHRVVHNRRRGEDKLICQTDDFIYIVDCDESKSNRTHFVCAVWSSQDKLVLLQT